LPSAFGLTASATDPDAKNHFEYGVSVSGAVWNQATTACKDLQPPGTLSGKRTPKQQSASLRFAQCVRDNGVKDFPDPANGEPSSTPIESDLDALLEQGAPHVPNSACLATDRLAGQRVATRLPRRPFST
jgi:hypothetical protein